MLKIRRIQLPKPLQKILDDWQTSADADNAGDSPWETFKKEERKRAEAGEPTILWVLKQMFCGKCAYCETSDADQTDHYWPKSPHPTLNSNRGTPARMFRWDNLFLSCHKCNSWECKGAHMKWDGDRPRLLNPCENDPLCYFKINLDYGSVLNGGRITPRSGLSPTARRRAEYTIRRLKLNERSRLQRDRLNTFRNFFDWLEMLFRFGPEYELPSGYTIRQRLADMLGCSEPYLASVRQFLHEEQELREALFAEIPELSEVIDRWDIRRKEG